MVCIPCIVIPVLLWIFHKYIQPFVLKFWNPWAKKSIDGQQDDVIKDIDKDCAEYQFIDTRIKKNPVMIFSKSTCSFCKMAKEVLDGTGVEYVEEEISQNPDCQVIQDMFQKLTGGRTVPRVFIGGQCVGGGSEVWTLHNQGELVPSMTKAGATFSQTDKKKD